MTEDRRTVEPQYQVEVDRFHAEGGVRLGPKGSFAYRTDPRHLFFSIARYKFVSKMLSGMTSVVEIGCGDGFGSQFVLQEVKRLHGVDIDPNFIAWAKDQAEREKQPATFTLHDMLEGPPGEGFDAAFSLDVIEHIPNESEAGFMRNVCRSLGEHGVCIIGTPNEAASAHASAGSVEGHINLKNAATLRELVGRYFHNVFLFSMNDEVVHTGYFPMAHYLFAIGASLRPLQ